MPDKIIPDFYELQLSYEDGYLEVHYFRDRKEISRYISVIDNNSDLAFYIKIRPIFLYYEEVESDYVV